jgi:hypothetical protein
VASVDMQVLRALRNAAAHAVWSTPAEIGAAVNVERPLPATSVTSAIRRLRTQGFVINHVKRSGRIREYSLRRDSAAN